MKISSEEISGSDGDIGQKKDITDIDENVSSDNEVEPKSSTDQFAIFASQYIENPRSKKEKDDISLSNSPKPGPSNQNSCKILNVNRTVLGNINKLDHDQHKSEDDKLDSSVAKETCQDEGENRNDNLDSSCPQENSQDEGESAMSCILRFANILINYNHI